MGTNNFVPILFGGLILAVVFVYFIFIRKPSRPSHIETSTIRRNRQAFNDNECSICLQDPKKFLASITCGHSYCGKCLIGLHRHLNQKLKCPLCRQEVNLIFRAWQNQQPKEEGLKIEQQIREYNNKFSDDRSFWRRFSEFPYVLRAASGRLLTPRFISYFFSTANLLKMAGTILIYLISPLDLMPELLLGAVGYLDDFWFFIVLFLYTVANSVVEYVRSRE